MDLIAIGVAAANGGSGGGTNGKDGKDGFSPTVNVTEIDGGHEVNITDKNGTKSFEVMDGEKGDKGDTGSDGYTPVKGTDYWTENDKKEIVDEVSSKTYLQGEIDTKFNSVNDDISANTEAINKNKTDILKVEERVTELEGTSLPDYWEEYLPSKIEQIKSLQKQGGKDCFSFVAIADIHYPSNLGKLSPKIAEKIMNEANVKFAVILGDTQTRGCYATEAEIIEENGNLKEMLLPIAQRMLRTRGNHDLSWGRMDRDGNGTYNNDVDGVIKPPEERETYIYSMTEGEVYEELFRPVGLVGNANFDKSGTGYWIDDTSNKVRYIILNTQNSKYELQADGTQKYPPMWVFRFQQSQFDMTINALNTVPTDEWGIVVCGHCPLWREIGDREVMQGVLSAYKNKTTYAGTYEGTASGGAAYTNLAEPLPDNTTDTTKWVNDYRYGSSGEPSVETGTTVSNMITISDSCTIRIKGATLRDGKDRFVLFVNETTLRGYFNNGISNSAGSVTYMGLTDGVYTFHVTKGESVLSGLRFTMQTPTNADEVIVTVDEEIINTEHGYDYVSVNTDFSEAKGNFIGYFAGHTHSDENNDEIGFPCITTRCDAQSENDDTKYERVEGTTTEQSFDVFTVNKKTKKIYATKIGAGSDREISY